MLLSQAHHEAIRFQHERLARLHAFWAERGREGRLPARSAFLAEEFRPWMGHIMMTDVTPARRFRVRLCGLAIVEYVGMDLTGRFLDEVGAIAAQETILAPYHACVRDRAPKSDTIEAPYEGATVSRLHRLLLPCSEDGETVDRIVTGVYADVQNRANKGCVYDDIYGVSDAYASLRRRPCVAH